MFQTINFIQGAAIFAHLFHVCVSYNLPICSPEGHLGHETKHPDPYNVENYYICERGILSLKKCQYNEIFDPIQLECSASQLHGLKSNFLENAIDVKSYRYPNEVEYECHKYEVYDDVDPGSCHHYYHCDDGVLSIKKCGWFQNFSPTQLRCRWFIFVNCWAKPHPIPTPIPDTTTQSTGSVSTSELTSSSTTPSTTHPTTSSTTEPTTASTTEPTTTRTTEPTTTSTTKLTTTSTTELTTTSTTELTTTSTTELTTTSTTHPTTSTKESTYSSTTTKPSTTYPPTASTTEFTYSSLSVEPSSPPSTASAATESETNYFK